MPYPSPHEERRAARGCADAVAILLLALAAPLVIAMLAVAMLP